MLYFKDTYPTKVYVLPANGDWGISVFRENEVNLRTGLAWKLSEITGASWLAGERPVRITRKNAERMMGNRSKFRRIIHSLSFDLSRQRVLNNH